MTHVTFLREVTASHVIVCCYSVSHSNCMISCDINYCVNGSICHFKFPKVVQAHTLGEVGNLGTVLLRVYSGTILPIFIEIGLYLTDNSKIYVGTVFFETRCICASRWSCVSLQWAALCVFVVASSRPSPTRRALTGSTSGLRRRSSPSAVGSLVKSRSSRSVARTDLYK